VVAASLKRSTIANHVSVVESLGDFAS